MCKMTSISVGLNLENFILISCEIKLLLVNPIQYEKILQYGGGGGGGGIMPLLVFLKVEG